jgi:hypothetical protein
MLDKRSDVYLRITRVSKQYFFISPPSDPRINYKWPSSERSFQHILFRWSMSLTKLGSRQYVESKLTSRPLKPFTSVDNSCKNIKPNNSLNSHTILQMTTIMFSRSQSLGLGPQLIHASTYTQIIHEIKNVQFPFIFSHTSLISNWNKNVMSFCSYSYISALLAIIPPSIN